MCNHLIVACVHSLVLQRQVFLVLRDDQGVLQCVRACVRACVVLCDGAVLCAGPQVSRAHLHLLIVCWTAVPTPPHVPQQKVRARARARVRVRVRVRLLCHSKRFRSLIAFILIVFLRLGLLPPRTQPHRTSLFHPQDLPTIAMVGNGISQRNRAKGYSTRK